MMAATHVFGFDRAFRRRTANLLPLLSMKSPLTERELSEGAAVASRRLLQSAALTNRTLPLPLPPSLSTLSFQTSK